jgi:hypothetical protein
LKKALNPFKRIFGAHRRVLNGYFFIVRNQDKRTVYTAVGGNEARGGALLLTWLEENYEAVRQFYGDTFVTNVKMMLRGFPEESSTEAEHQRLQARIDNEIALNLFRAVLWIRISRNRIFGAFLIRIR